MTTTVRGLGFVTMDDIVLIVEDTFRIRGRGILVEPAVDTRRVTPERLAVELTYPDGTTRQVPGQLATEFAILLDGGRRSDVRIIVDESAGVVPPGTKLTAHIVIILDESAGVVPPGTKLTARIVDRGSQ